MSNDGSRHLLGLAGTEPSLIRSLVDASLERLRAPAAARSCTVGLLFFEPSTRTRVGFEVATLQLGGRAVAVTATKETPAMSRGESWEDLVRSVGDHFDVLCIRHPDEIAPYLAADLVERARVVNCGNGRDEHPTQAIIDLASIGVHLGELPDELTVTIVGDLLNTRSAHSLLLGLAMLPSVRVRAVSPAELRFPRRYSDPFCARGHLLEASSDLDSSLNTSILYMAGFAPRTPLGSWNDADRAPFILTEERAQRLPESAAVLCPLPRIDEIEQAVDAFRVARYFHNTDVGTAVRTALLEHVLS